MSPKRILKYKTIVIGMDNKSVESFQVTVFSLIFLSLCFAFIVTSPRS